MSKIEKFLNYSWATLLVVLLLCVSTIFNGIVYMIFIYPRIEDMCLKSVTEEECIEHRKDIYKWVSEIAKEHGYKTQEVRIAEGLDKLAINIDTMSRIEYVIWKGETSEYFVLDYFADDVKYQDRGKKINIDFLLQIANLASAMKITESDINELLSNLEYENKSRKDKLLIPFVIEEISYSLSYEYYDGKEFLKIGANTFNCYNLDILN